jgi:hypothetical protein
MALMDHVIFLSVLRLQIGSSKRSTRRFSLRLTILIPSLSALLNGAAKCVAESMDSTDRVNLAFGPYVSRGFRDRGRGPVPLPVHNPNLGLSLSALMP